VVISVRATTGDPHQASDHKYYRRHNFNRSPMEHYEVRDMMRRATTPELFVRLSLPGGHTAQVDFAYREEISKPITLQSFIGNRSNQPAFHTLVEIGLDLDLVLRSPGDYEQIGTRTDEVGNKLNYLRRRLSTPPDLPIFKESETSLNNSSLTFAIRSNLMSATFFITTVVLTPGFAATVEWALRTRGGAVTLVHPEALRDLKSRA
jgi:hypothetical protein